MRPSYDAVILDFDYTLADSSPGIIACVNHALTKLGLPTASAEEIRPTIGIEMEMANIPAPPVTDKPRAPLRGSRSETKPSIVGQK